MCRFYSSHGHWTTLERIYELETERGNQTDFIEPYLHHGYMALWVTDVQTVYQYVDEGYEPVLIEMTEAMQIIGDDGDDGYLVIRPVEYEVSIQRESWSAPRTFQVGGSPNVALQQARDQLWVDDGCQYIVREVRCV